MTHTIAIVGSGIAGVTLAYHLTQQGHQVHIFEKGPTYPYPTSAAFSARLNLSTPDQETLPETFRKVITTGDIPYNPDEERRMRVGGQATSWQAISLRMNPSDFRTQTQYRFGSDWAIDYDELELYYTLAEAHLGVSGTDDDNPFAPPRSQPYPLPPFELGYYDRFLAAQLREADLHLHTTPQARTRESYNGRTGCQNFGACDICPIGARYSPGFHLQQAIETGNCTLHINTSVRRVIVENGKAVGLLIQANDAAESTVFDADTVVVAAGAIESTRLLLLSANDQYRDGLGNHSGFLGTYFGMHKLRVAEFLYETPIFHGQTGFYTGQSHQFVDHPDRATKGGIKIEFSSNENGPVRLALPGADVLTEFPQQPSLKHRRPFYAHAESEMTPNKNITLAEESDPLGDPCPHLHYELSDFDHRTYAHSTELMERFAQATHADVQFWQGVNQWVSGAHHMGGCRMSSDADDGVVDAFHAIHGVAGVYVLGASNFATTSPVNPTLTITALSIRLADILNERVS